jgi:predicted nucleic acid-binding protein
MIRGVDTTFLVQLELRETEGHQKAHAYLDRGVLGQGHQLALAPQVLEEFIHVATDGKRFEKPLSMTEALDKADFWGRAAEVQPVHPDAQAMTLFIEWIRALRIGRRRVHDALLAATYLSAGIKEIITSDREGFQAFGGLIVCDPLTWTG